MLADLISGKALSPKGANANSAKPANDLPPAGRPLAGLAGIALAASRAAKVPPYEPADLAQYCATQGVYLLRDDCIFLLARLPFPVGARVRILRRYVNQWRAEAEQEPIAHKKQNAGRFAANSWLRQKRDEKIAATGHQQLCSGEN